MHDLKKTPVGDIVKEYPSAAKVFAQYQIDFCCGGEKPLEQACEKKQVDPEKLVEEVKSQNSASAATTPRFDRWNPRFLADYIEENHHSFVRNNIPVILKWSRKVATVHGQWKPENVEISQVFDELSRAMYDHLEKEEKEAFPLIREMQQAAEKGDQEGLQKAEQKFEKVLHEMKDEHEEAGHQMSKIQELSNNFTPPQEACNTYKALYNALHDFQEDLHQHVHLENNILFPKAEELKSYQK